MSLVNEMLNELQKEKPKGGNFDGLVAVNNQNKQNDWIKISLVLILVVVTSYVLWLQFFNQQENSSFSNTSKTALTAKGNIDADTSLPTTNIEGSKLDLAQVKGLAEKVVNKSNQQNSLPVVLGDSNNLAKPLENLSSQPVESQADGLSVDSQIVSTQPPKKATSVPSDKEIEKLASTEPSNRKLSKQLAKPKKSSMIKVSRKSKAEKQLRLIASQWVSKSQAENKMLVEQFLQEFSDLDSAWLGAINLSEDKDLAYHQKLLDQALGNFPGQPAFRMILVKQQIAQNNYANALTELQKIDSKQWQQNQFRIAGFLAQKVNDHVSAIKFYNQLLKNKPNQGDINMAIAISLEALNENGLAVAKFQRALEDSSLKPIQRQFIAQRIAVLKG